MVTGGIGQNNMSVAHSGVSFKHSCLKVPVDPASKKPKPNYERIYSQKLSGNVDYGRRRETSAQSSNNSSLENNYKSVESYLQFYETIPDYSELHHLSDEEFYSRLKSLKITQKRFCGGEAMDCDALEDRPSSHSSLGSRTKYDPERVYLKPKRISHKKDTRLSSGYSNSSTGKKPGIEKNMRSWSSSEVRSRRKVNESDFEEKANFGECFCGGCERCRENSVSSWKKDEYTDDGWISDDGCSNRKSKSMPNSPCWKPKFGGYDALDHCNCCFNVRIRHEKPDVPLCDLHAEESSGVKPRELSKKPEKFKTRPVPLLSRIPLYDKIMAEQEKRRRVNHNRFSKELRASIQPFSFTKREEEEKQKMRMTCSNPELNSPSRIRSQNTFKAKPIPKNLFSNYAYERMREEDFYRALKKRVRAEELLKSSSLPPSMAAREKHRSKSLDFLDNDGRYKFRGQKRPCELFLRDAALDGINRTGKSKRRGRPFWAKNKSANSITDSSTEVSPYESISEPERRHQKRPHSAISVNRSNLASVLRMQTVRKRMEKEMAENLEENRLKQQSKFKERLIRMTPAWRALNYSTEEDLALRVAARREEERLRKKRHDKLMASIYGRVHQMPPLFQRQSKCLKQAEGFCDAKTENNNNEKRENDFSSATYRAGNRFGTPKSSESSGSREKSEEGTKNDESDEGTGSHLDEIEDYVEQQMENHGEED